MTTQPVTPQFNPPEIEAISLLASTKALDAMVNHLFIDVSHSQYGTEVRFKTEEHASLFNALLTDFLAEKTSSLTERQESRLSALTNIASSPSFSHSSSEAGLLHSCNEFNGWLLSTTTFTNVWFPNVGIETDLILERRFYITMCGNIDKHNDINLSVVARKLREMMENHGHNISEHESYILIGEFYEWFQQVVFYKHATSIIMYLNNIRHGIREYLIPEYKSVARPVYDDFFKATIHRIEIPSSIKSEYGKYCYHDLLNTIKGQPYVAKFDDPLY